MRRNDHTNIEIALLQKETIPYPQDTVEFAKALSSKAREITVSFKGTTLFNLPVPKNVYNPYGNGSCPLLLDMVMTQEIDTSGKSLVDLGCGSGILGLTATLQGCKQVLYTDINPGVIAIRNHPLFRPSDTVQVQDLCRSEADGSHDLVIMCPPSDLLSRKPRADNYESAVYLDSSFMGRVVKEAARVLKPRGRFVFSYWVYPDQIDRLVSIVTDLSYHLLNKHLECLLQVPEGKEGTRCVFSAYRE